MWMPFLKRQEQKKECKEKLNVLLKHNCDYERIGVYYKERDYALAKLVDVYVVEVLRCRFCRNMVENILTKATYDVDKEQEDLVNYVKSMVKYKIPSELEYKLENEGKYPLGEYNFS